MLRRELSLTMGWLVDGFSAILTPSAPAGRSRGKIVATSQPAGLVVLNFKLHYFLWYRNWKYQRIQFMQNSLVVYRIILDAFCLQFFSHKSITSKQTTSCLQKWKPTYNKDCTEFFADNGLFRCVRSQIYAFQTLKLKKEDQYCNWHCLCLLMLLLDLALND